MHRRVLLPLFALVLFTSALAGEAAKTLPPAEPYKAILKKGDRVCITGDSITEQKQYSKFMELYLTACVPQFDLWVIQYGWSGETAGGLAGRIDDVLLVKPNVVTTCYGMNDGGYRAYADGIGKSYGDNMARIVQALKGAGATVLVGSPGAVDYDAFKRSGTPVEVYNDNLAHLRDIAKALAEKEGQIFANVHDPMILAMDAAKPVLGKTYHVCGGDGFHPAPNGHIVMAYAFLKAMGLDGNIGTLMIDMDGQGTASDGHKVLSTAKGTIELESTRYPFCFYGDEKKPDGSKSIVPYVPFNKDLNRLMLTVKNLTTAKAKVTWGTASKSFTKEQLTEGINLAHEFLDNPFSPTFAEIEKVVANKQNYETGLTKNTLRALAGLKGQLLEDAEAQAAIKTLQQRSLAKQQTMAEAVRKAIVPVKHTIAVVAE